MVLPVNYNKLNGRSRRAVREEYVRAQGGKCYYCGGPLDQGPPAKITDMSINWRNFPPGFLQVPVHLQHDHVTGMTEGAVHGYCNAVLWQYEGR
jgi:hypothetical protein